MIVDLPAPVAPTMARLWPAGAQKETSRSTHSSPSYANQTWRNSMSPRKRSGSSWLPVGSHSVSRSSKMRSDEAIATCRAA